MQRHEKGDARVIPVIVHPCDWHGTPFGKLLATPTDGKPISKFPNPHDAYLEVTMAVRKAAKEMQKSQIQTDFELSDLEKNEPNTVKVPEIRSSNLRIKKTFTDKDKDKSLREAFEYLAKFFEGSLTELEIRNKEVETDFCRIDARHFTAKIYVNGTEASRCRIWFGGRNSFQEGIYYSNSDTGNDNSFNEALNIEEDGYTISLKPLGMRIHSQHDAGSLSFEGAAEYFWGMFIEYLQG